MKLLQVDTVARAREKLKKAVQGRKMCTQKSRYLDLTDLR